MKTFAIGCIALTILFGCGKPLPPSALKVASGSVIRHANFPSEYIPARNVDVWLPEGYSEESQYNVLYMHDGQMLFDSTITWNKQEWGVDEVMGKLLAANKIKPTMVVGIWNGDQDGGKRRTTEYFPQKAFYLLPQNQQDSIAQLQKGNQPMFTNGKEPESDRYLKFLIEELKPFIDREYATLPAKENTFVMGSSYGGLISMYAICEYPDIFAAAACLSTHWPGLYTADNPIPAAFLQYLSENLPNPNENSIYFDFGTATLDALYEPFQQKADSIMQANGFTSVNWITRKFEGAAHTEKDWNQRLEVPLQFLLGN